MTRRLGNSLRAEIATLRTRLGEAEEALRAIRAGDVDALVIGERVYRLQGAETPYRLLIEEMGEGACMLMENGTILYANRRLADMLGAPLEKIVGSRLRHWVVDEDLAAYEAWLVQGRDNPTKGELRLRGSDNRSVPALISLGMLEMPEAHALGMVVTDLAERKRIEAELRSGNRALRMISACNQALIHAGNEADLLNGICQSIITEGGHLFAWFGYAEHDEAKTVRVAARAGRDEGFLDQAAITWADTERGRGPTGTTLRTGVSTTCAHVRTDPQFAPWRAAALQSGFESSIALPLKAADGVVFGALSIYSGRPDAFGEKETRLLFSLASDLGYGLGVLRIRDEHQKSEIALRLSEQRFDLAVRGSAAAIWDWNVGTGDCYFAPRYRELLGYSQIEFPNRIETFFNLLNPDDAAHVREALAAHFSAGRRPFNETFRLRAKSGEYLWFRSQGQAVYDAEGRAGRMVGAASDITEQKQAQAEILKLNQELEQRVRERTSELQTANAELEAFVYTVSHDLRAPLRAIDGFSRILQEEAAAKLDDEARDNLERVRTASQHMGNLIDAVLRLSRLTRGELRRTQVDLSALALDVFGELRRQEPQRAVEVSVQPGLVVNADPSLIRSVLENLIGNAWKFSSRQPKPKIDFGRLAGACPPVFYVRDNGVGFDQAYSGKLFGVFQQLHRAGDFSGTGVGLASVQRFIHRHGGRVWAESEVGKGATFFFTLEPAAIP